MMELENAGSVGRKKSFIISHSGKFKSKNRKRISITDEIWIGPKDDVRNKVSWISLIWHFSDKLHFKTPMEAQKSNFERSSDENKTYGLPTNVISDKKLPGDKNIRETPSNQHKEDYKVADNAVWALLPLKR